MMELIENELTEILRSQSKLGADRRIAPDQPLSSLGLDSLSLLNFLLAAEQRFGMELPDGVWSSKGSLTLRRFVDIIFETTASGISRPAMNGGTPAPAKSPMPQESPEGADEENGKNGHPVPREVGPVMKALAPLYARQDFVVLERDLLSGKLPDVCASIPLTYRAATAEDIPALQGFWPPEKQERKMRRFSERLASGFVPLTAWNGNEILGIDWLSGTGDFEPLTGLRIAVRPGTCYGFDLYEKRGGLGVGFALFCLSLHEAHRRGYQRQVTIVNSGNAKMIAASMKLVGFAQVGEIHTRKVLQRPVSTWRLGDQRGRGNILTV